MKEKKLICMDFRTRTLCLDVNNYPHPAIEYLMPNITPQKMQWFAPKNIQLEDDGCYSWNFVDNLFIVNEKVQEDLTGGAMLAPESFKPIRVIPMPGLHDVYESFLDAIDKCEEILNINIEELFYQWAVEGGAITEDDD